MADLRGIASSALSPIRRGRSVAWTPGFMGLGNLLQLAMWAHDGQLSGHPRWIRSTPRLEPWLTVFPGLQPIVLRRDEIRFTDRRVFPWSEAARAAGAAGTVPLHERVDVSAVEHFVRDVLLPGSTLPCNPAEASNELLVVNVRRGDYYSDPDNRRQYGFDVLNYVRVALNAAVARDGLPTAIVVVSDDIEWCRRQLSWLADVAPTRFSVAAGPVEDFAVVSSARRAIITNSTFSYWAAHVGNVVHGDNHSQVWAPRFFDRTQNGGRSWLLDERWSVVEKLDTGWDEQTGEESIDTGTAP